MKKIIFPHFLYSFIFLSAFIGFPLSASAETYVSDSNWINETWTTANSPYIVDGAIYYRYGSLSIEPGVVVKFATATSSLMVHADVSFSVNGTVNKPVYFTSIKDDTVGGDTNKDGNATLPASGDWGYVSVGGGSYNNGLNINYLKVRYGGSITFSNGISPALALYFNWYSYFPSNDYYLENIEVSNSKTGLYAYVSKKQNLYVSNSSFYDNEEYGMYTKVLYLGKVDAVNNWWGDASGPYNPTQNPSGLGNAISNNINFTPWLDANPLAPVTPTCCSNVIFLPGLKASRLYKEGTIFENQLWEPNTDADVEKLLLDSSGNSINSDIYTRNIIDQANIIPGDLLSPLRQNFYISFKNEMNTLRDDGVINDWKALPYDWRLDFDDILENGSVVGAKGDEENISYLSATSSPYIIQEIERLAKSSANGKVTIVAHSNGGLLAKKLIDKLETKGEADLIENLILVATPQLGTPKAITSLLHGYREDIPKDLGFFASREIAREFGRNMISGYNLLPSSMYMDRVKDVDEFGVVQNSTTVIEFDPSLERLADTIAFRDFWGAAVTTLDSIFNYRDYYGGKISTAQKLNEFLRGAEGRTEPASDELEYPIKLTSLFLTSADDTHGSLDIWQPPQNSSIQVIQIAGWGLDTIRGVKYVAKDKQVCVDNLSMCLTLPVLDMEPLFTSDGDRVVVTPSATSMSTSTYPTYYVNIPDHNNEIFIGFRRNREHADILEIDSVLTLIKNIVKNEPTDNIEHISNTKPERTPGDTNLRLVLRSPVSINIYDSLGNHTGITLDEASGVKYTEEQIPNSYYMEFGEGKYLGIDTSEGYRIELQGEDFGTFTFEIQEVLGDEILNTVSYTNIPVSASTTATLSLQNLDTTPELAIDIDGDGTADVTLNGGEEDIQTSIEILAGLIDNMDIHKGLKKELIKKLKKVKKKLKKVKKELKKGKAKKAIKKLDKIIKKLKKEIKKNLEVEYNEEYEEEEEEKKEHKEYQKKKNHHDNGDKKKHKDKKEKKHHEDYDDDKTKISTENAWMLISIVEDIKSLLI